MKENQRPYKIFNLTRTLISGSLGMSLVETLVAAAIMGVAVLGMMNMQQSHLKSTNYLEFQLKKVQLQNLLLGQVLNNSDNCACFFKGASPFPDSPSAPGATVSVASLTQIGRYRFVVPGVCSTATMPQPLIDDTGIDWIKMKHVELRKILKISTGQYTGEFALTIQSLKQVAGPQELLIPIPVNIQTIPSGGGNVAFVSCSTQDSSAPVQTFIPKRLSNQCTVPTWNSNPYASCSPAACAGGESQLNTGCEATGDFGGWTTYSCERLCYTGTLAPGSVFKMHCPFLQSGNNSYGNIVCTPAACPATSTQKDLSCQSTYTGSGYMKGSCHRTCVTN